jgi:secondary thiamine-phosphate synthase enzyme
MDGSLLEVANETAPLIDTRALAARVYCEAIELDTEEALQFIDVTPAVIAIVEKSGVAFGQAIVYSTHTTAAIKINENEPLLLDDLRQMLQRLAPCDGEYGHNDFRRRTVNMNEEECANGHSHCQHLFLSSSEAVPVVDGRLILGQWQRIFLVELDRPRQRRLIVNVLGVESSDQ